MSDLHNNIVMAEEMDKIFYHRSDPQSPYEFMESAKWGKFIRYIEFAGDGFPSRQVDEFENGYLARYDREHWSDQFGTLADFKYGKTWRKHWGKPHFITREEFELKWHEVGKSPPFKLRRTDHPGPPPWIELFESGHWKGQP